jgi:putative ABC transport system substrate-binding protein
VASPFTAGAQQGERVRRIGVLMGWNESDPEAQSDLAGFVQELHQLGWIDGRNMRIDYRWSDGDVNRMQIFAKEFPTTTITVARGVDSRPHLASILQEGRKSTNIHAGSGVI